MATDLTETNFNKSRTMKIKYEKSLLDRSICITPCPNGVVDIAYSQEPIKVGSVTCYLCDRHEFDDQDTQTVTCNHQEESK